MTISEIKQYLFSGSYWLVARKFFIYFFSSVISAVILGRILSPFDFGLNAMVLFFMAICEAFTQSGFFNALIQEGDETVYQYFDAAWTIQIIRGGFLFLLVYLLSPLAAIIFHEPEIVVLLQVVSFSYLIDAFANIGVIDFVRKYQFEKNFISTVANVVVSVSVAIMCAYFWHNAMAFIVARLAASICNVYLSYRLSDYRPRWELNFKKINKLFKFGKWIMGSSVIIFFLEKIQPFFVGRILGASAMGLNQTAYNISDMVAQEAIELNSSICPAICSRVGFDFSTLRKLYIGVLQLTALAASIFSTLIFVLSYDLLHIFLGNQWVGAMGLVKIFALAAFLKAIGGTTGPFFLGINRPDIIMKLLIFRFLFLLSAVITLTYKFGISGAAAAVLLSFVVEYPVMLIVFSKKIDLKLIDVLKSIFFPVLASLISIYFAYIIVGDRFFHDLHFFPLMFFVILTLLLYFLVLFGLYRIMKWDNIVLLQNDSPI